MGATYTRQSSSAIVDGGVIEASDINAEFNQILAAFAVTSGHTHDGTDAEGGPITKLLGTAITIGDATSGTDIAVTFDGESADGVLTWMEDEDYFQFSDDLLLTTTEKLQFRDTAIYINSSADGQLDLVADTEIQIAATTIDINGAVALNGAITGATNITLSGELDAATLDISGDADIDGTLETDALSINGTVVTSTAAELNILDGVTSTAAELNVLDGITAVVGELNALDIGSTAVGTAVASKAVILDANKDYTGIRNLTISGDLTVTGDDITMGTNTAGNILVADGTNFNSIAVGGLSEISTVANDDVFLAVDTSGGGLKKIARSAIVSGLAASGAISNVADDSTPQLGGDLDMNGADIVTTSNADLELAPNGTGHVTIRGNTNQGTIQFNCENNSHGQQVKAAPHSESASNVLTLPSTGGDARLVSAASTATLTNKTLTAPKIADGGFIADANGNELIIFQTTGSAVNEIEITNNAAGSNPIIAATGGDTNIGIALTPKGTGEIVIGAGNLNYAGTAITSTGAELNILDGVTSTAAELNILDGVTSTAAELNVLDGITAVVGELNALDLGSTAVGTAIASKAVILDSNKDYTGFRNITLSGELDAGSLDISGDADIDGTTNLDVVDIDGAVDMASTLQVDGAITSSAGATITTADNTDTLSLISTDADANSGPNLRMYRNSSSPADSDLIGNMQFEGRNDNSQDVVYGEISARANDVSDGTEDGLIFIKAMTAGTLTEYMRFDPGSSGIIINDGSADLDFRVETNAEANAFKIDGGSETAAFGVPVTFNDAANVAQEALTSSSNAVAWDATDKPNAFHLTTENTTFSAPSNAVEGAFICLEINYNGSHTIAFNTVFEFAASTAPTTTDTDGKTDILVFRYNGSVWQEVGRTLNLSES